MKQFIASFALIAYLVLGQDALAQKNSNVGDLLVGNWQPSDGRSVVSIYKGNASKGEDPEKYYGKVVWLLEVNDENGKLRTDVNNPDESLRSKPLKGLVILKGLEFVGDEDDLEWENGEIYDPKNGSTYDFYAEMSPKKTNILDARGYIGVSLFGRTDTWKRLVKKK